MADTPRIALIHALAESVLPARNAFQQGWSDAFCFDLLETSLSMDLAAQGALDEQMIGRFHALANYAVQRARADAILFTCSAFGLAIESVKAAASVPVLRPNEAAFESALDAGRRIGLVASFAPSIPALSAELQEMATARGKTIEVVTAHAASALSALKAGDGKTHDREIVRAAASLGEVDVIILGQFSVARAADEVRKRTECKVLTTPAAAVEALRLRVAGQASGSQPFRKGCL